MLIWFRLFRLNKSHLVLSQNHKNAQKRLCNQHLNALKRFPVENVVISIFVTSIQKSPIFITRPKNKKSRLFRSSLNVTLKSRLFICVFFDFVVFFGFFLVRGTFWDLFGNLQLPQSCEIIFLSKTAVFFLFYKLCLII